MIDYDLELRHHNDVLRRTYGIRDADRVLDIGCGTGQTTREAARLATAGAVLGIDRSDAMIERARALAGAARLRNVDHECADIILADDVSAAGGSPPRNGRGLPI